MSYTLDESGAPLTETKDGVTMPVDYTFETVNDWVHRADVQFEELQALCLGMAIENDKLRKALQDIRKNNNMATTEDLKVSKYTKLVEAAKKIDELSIKQEQRTKAWQELARDARKPDTDRREIERRRSELDAGRVIDFGSAIAELRRALKAL